MKIVEIMSYLSVVFAILGVIILCDNLGGALFFIGVGCALIAFIRAAYVGMW